MVEQWLAGNPASIISLVLIGSALLSAYSLSQPKWRIAGTRLISLALLAVGLILVFESYFGYATEPAKNPLMGEIKQALILIQGLVAAVCGAWLLTRRLAPSCETLPIQNEPQRFGAGSRYIHWTTAILFLGLIPMGIYMSMIPEDAWYRHTYLVVHKTLGIVVMALVVLRVVWNLSSARPAISDALKPWEKTTARIAHGALYFLLLAIPLSGFLMSSFAGKPIHFFAWDLPALITTNKDLAQPFGLLHKFVLPYLCYLILGLHIIGALKHQLVDKHSQVLNRMVG